MATVIYLLIFLGLPLIGLSIYWAHLAEKKRREGLQALAAELGWAFSQDKDRDHDERFRQFNAFRQGNGRYALNTLWGDVQGRQAKMGDFHFETQSTNDKGQTTTNHHHISYVLIAFGAADAPALTVRPEGFFDKIGAALGFDDIDFESAEFSRKFHVKSPDRKFAYAVIHPQMMEFLMERRGPTYDLNGGWFCLTEGAGVWTPQKFREMLTLGLSFLERFPKHVVADLQSRPTAGPTAPGPVTMQPSDAKPRE